MHDPPPTDTDTGCRGRHRTVVLVAVVFLMAGLVAPLLAGIGSATAGNDETNESTPVNASGPSPPPAAARPQAGAPPAAPPTPLPGPPGSAQGNGTATNESWTGPTYDACADKGIIQGAICNVIENAKHRILGGAIDTTGKLIGSTLALILHRPAPMQGGELAVLRPPTNQPLVGAFRAWTTVGLPLGFMVWVLGVGIALASRFQPDTGFAAHGFLIEEQLGRNLLLTIGSWWLGAFVLHLTNGLILAVAPRGKQFLMSPEAGVGSVIAAGAFVWVLNVAAAVVTGVLFAATILSYFLCLNLLGYLSVFSALLLFDTGGVLQTISWFGKKGWDVFIRAALFPLPAALVLGGGTYIAGGVTTFVERSLTIGGLGAIAGTLAYAAVMFATLVTALLASLWMVMGARGASTAAGVLAGLGGAALYKRAKSRAKGLAGKASMPNVGMNIGTDSPGWSPGDDGEGSRWGGALGSGETSDTAGALGPGRSDPRSGGLTPMGVPTGGRPRSTDQTTGSATGDQAGTATGPDMEAGGGEGSGPVVVESEADLPAGQNYQPGYVSDGEFKPVESRGLDREFVVREHDRFAEAYDAEGDHGGIYLRGGADDSMYDASPVAGEDWGLSVTEEAGMSRDAVYDARNAGGGPQ